MPKKSRQESVDSTPIPSQYDQAGQSQTPDQFSDAESSVGNKEVVSESASSGDGTIVLKPLRYNLTLPPPDDYYFVREDQLESLTKRDKDYSLEISVCAAGGAFGLAQNLLAAISTMVIGGKHNNIDLTLAFIALALAVLAITKFVEFWKTSGSVNNLKEQIKSGQKAEVRE